MLEESGQGHLVARGYLGLFSFFFERDRSPLLACLLASIQPRTSPPKFGGKFNSIFIRLLRHEAGPDGKDAVEAGERAYFMTRTDDLIKEGRVSEGR